ncbi:MAG: BPL-N domain-containing protein [Candidatus Sulfotelmatobacter sp.]
MSLLTPPSKVRWGFIIVSGSVLLISLTACGTPAVTPASAAPAESDAAQTSSPSVLLFVGTGTSSTDVTAVETILSTNKLAYATATSAQLDDMSQSELMAYKLLIVPGGDSITIGDGLTSTATNTVHDAVQQGLHYLGICAGGFFGGYSEYNGLNLTSGVWFNFYEDYNEGIYKAAVEVSQPNGTELDQYWQDGPQFTGWGDIVGKYPNGTPAIVEGKSGSGWVILSGIHAEAPASWRIGMTFTTPVQTDNAYAYTLIEAALNGTSLPYY